MGEPIEEKGLESQVARDTLSSAVPPKVFVGPALVSENQVRTPSGGGRTEEGAEGAKTPAGRKMPGGGRSDFGRLLPALSPMAFSAPEFYPPKHNAGRVLPRVQQAFSVALRTGFTQRALAS